MARTKQKQLAILRSRTLQQLAGLIAAAILIAGIGAAISATPNRAYSSGSGAPLAGWLWSDTVGWISLSCNNDSSCGTSAYGMSMASDGTLSGKGWSENIGWVSADPSDTSTCGPQAAIASGGSVTGWLRALGGNTAQSGGWDGCIGLSGWTSSVAFNQSTGAFSGYGWGGGTTIGWVDFSKASAAASCVPQQMCIGNASYNQTAYCQQTLIKNCTGTCTGSGVCSEDLPPPAGSLSVAPSLVREGQSTQVTWDSADAYACEVSGSNGDSWSGTSGTATSSPITDSVTYTLSCRNDGGSMSVIKQVSVYLVPVYHEI